MYELVFITWVKHRAPKGARRVVPQCYKHFCSSGARTFSNNGQWTTGQLTTDNLLSFCLNESGDFVSNPFGHFFLGNVTALQVSPAWIFMSESFASCL